MVPGDVNDADVQGGGQVAVCVHAWTPRGGRKWEKREKNRGKKIEEGKKWKGDRERGSKEREISRESKEEIRKEGKGEKGIKRKSV